MISHRQRIENCLAGKPLDRVPVALWRHFPVDDQDGHLLARATANFQHSFDFDLIKVTGASSYCVRDWGVSDTWCGNAEGTRERGVPVVKSADDWLALKPLNPKKGSLGQMLIAMRELRREFPDTPILHTVFSPLSQAKNLVGKTLLAEHVRLYPEAVHAGLRVISETTAAFISEIVKTGIDGIFYSIQYANPALISIGEYHEFGKLYDMQLNESITKFWLNLYHIHGEPILFDEVLDHPAKILNWHDQATAPSLTDAKQHFDGVVCGGLSQRETLLLSTAAEVTRQAKAALKDTRGERFILGAGCVTPITTPFGNIMAVRKAVEPKK